MDDFLPVSQRGQLIFCRKRGARNEFWSALLEKAYAKVCGSYELMEGGLTCDGLVDLSGGIQETFKLYNVWKSKLLGVADSKEPDQEAFWNILVTAKNKHSVVGCNVKEANVSLARLANLNYNQIGKKSEILT